MSFSLFGKLVHLIVKERMEYRGDFILNAFAQIISYFANYVVIWLFISKFKSIAGWSWPEIALLYSIGLFTYALGASFSYVQMTEMEERVRSGTYDTILTKPVNSYLYVVCRGFNVAYVAHFAISLTFLFWSLGQLQVEWTLFKMVYFLIALISGAMIQMGIMTMIGACSFIWIRNNVLFTLFFRLREFTSYPIPVYGTFIQVILVFIVPLAFINFYPSAYLLSKPAPLIGDWGKWIIPFIGPVCLAAGYLFWLWSEKRYQGAGG